QWDATRTAPGSEAALHRWYIADRGSALKNGSSRYGRSNGAAARSSAQIYLSLTPRSGSEIVPVVTPARSRVPVHLRLGELALVLAHHLLGQVLARHVVDRVGEVLVLAVGPLAARHGDEQPRIPTDDLEPADHERVVQRDAHERLQLFVVA